MIFILLVTLIPACSIRDDEDIKVLFPTDLVLVNNTSLNAEFTATVFCGSYCWKSTSFESSIKGGDIFIKTFAVFDGSTVCPQVCVEYKTPINITLPVSGDYTFHFWRSDTSSIDTVIAIHP